MGTRAGALVHNKMATRLTRTCHHVRQRCATVHTFQHVQPATRTSCAFAVRAKHACSTPQSTPPCPTHYARRRRSCTDGTSQPLVLVEGLAPLLPVSSRSRSRLPQTARSSNYPPQEELYGWQLVWRFSEHLVYRAGDVGGAVLITTGEHHGVSLSNTQRQISSHLDHCCFREYHDAHDTGALPYLTVEWSSYTPQHTPQCHLARGCRATRTQVPAPC